MTLDEAIKHAEEVAEEHTKYNRYGGFESCDKCAEEHQQLAKWLKELKRLKEQEPCEDAISRQAVLDQAMDYGSNTYLVPVNSIKALPPVTPKAEQTRWIPK